MSVTPVRVCDAHALQEGGLAVPFTLPDGTPAFAVRWQGVARAYENRCPHMGVPIDFNGRVFVKSGTHLMCMRHGATFLPDTGVCDAGPCAGGALAPVALREEGGAVWAGA